MNQIARPASPTMTADEFLAWPGDGTGRKFELVDGRLRPVSPASPTHGYIQANLAILIGVFLRQQRSTSGVITDSGVISGINPSRNVRSPDVIVTETSVRRIDKTVRAPILLVEVLSPGNQINTRSNVKGYQAIGSVREILVVHSTRVKAELLQRDEHGRWPAAAEIVLAGHAVSLFSGRLAFPIEEAYAGTWLAG